MTSGPAGIAIVGLGRWAHAHANAAARTDAVDVVSCFSRNEDRCTAFAGEFGVPRIARSFHDILADPAVEGVVISTPNDLHVEMGLAAIEAGKPVLIDKPISVDIGSGLRLLRAGPGGDQVGIAHHARRLAGHRATAEWLRTDGGTCRLAHADFSNARGAAMKPDAWHRSVQSSEAGVLIQVGIHQIDTVLSLFGPAVAVNARLAYRTLGHMADAAVVIIQHKSGVISTVTSSWTTPGLFRLEVQATGGNLRYRLDHSHWTSGDVDANGELTLDRDGEHGVQMATRPGDPLAEQLIELAGAARRQSTMEVDVAAGLRAITVVIAAVRSAEQRGAEVDLGRFLMEEGATAEEVATLTGEALEPASNDHPLNREHTEVGR